MRLGIATEETWNFFNEIYAGLQQRYTTTVFQRRQWRLPFLHERINVALLQYDLRKFLQNNDVVFFEWASGLLVLATQMPKQCAIVTRLHRYELYEWADQVNWDAVDKIIVVSHAKKREFAARFPQQAGKLVVSPPSTSLEKFTPKPKAFSGDIGILCHLTPRKRVYELILTFYELTQKRNDLHLHIGGGEDPKFTDYAHALHHLVEQLNLQDKVTFYGNVREPWQWYSKIDIFVSNSYSEGLQVAPMEAMASGCYCLAHHWGGAEELLPADYLYMTDRQLQEKILQYVDLSEEQKQVQKTRMRTIAAERFDINQTVRQIIETIDSVTINKNKGSQSLTYSESLTS